jgi:hypothetical protein
VSIRFSCPRCSKSLTVADGAEGKKARCPECRAVVRVPGDDGNAIWAEEVPAAWPARGADGDDYDADRPSRSRRRPRDEDCEDDRPARRKVASPANYYVKNHQGKVIGPCSGAALRKMVRDRQLDLSWQISADRVNWCTAAKVKNLSADLERVLAQNLSTGDKYRDLTRAEVVALFLDKFVLSNENFKDSFPILQPFRVLWAKITLPKNFVITEVTASGVRHMRYNVGEGEAYEIDEKEASRNVNEAVKQFNWFILLAGVLGLGWLSWTLIDFVRHFSLTWETVKVAFFAALAFAGFIIKTKRSKVFVGYELDPVAVKRLEEIAVSLSALRACSRVWMFQVQQGEGRQHWKYNAGDTFKVARLPLAVFHRAIPNVETNVRVHGITYHSQAIYFLPDKVLVIDGNQVRDVPYQALQVGVSSLEYVEGEGHIYRDSLVVDHRWRFINRNGSPDRRFKYNEELPVVRCGILELAVGKTYLEMMTTNPKTPKLVQQKFEALKAGTV